MHNTHQDYKVEFKHEIFSKSTKAFDATSGNIEFKDFFKGRIHEYSMYKDDFVLFPNKTIFLEEYYTEYLKHFLGNYIEAQIRAAMKDNIQYETYISLINTMRNNDYFNKLQNKTSRNTHLYAELEDYFMRIQTIPQFPKALNFVNIHNIKQGNLMADELHYLEKEISSCVDTSIFTSSQNMQRFLVKALERYQHYYDKSAFHTIKPLGIKYP